MIYNKQAIPGDMRATKGRPYDSSSIVGDGLDVPISERYHL